MKEFKYKDFKIDIDNDALAIVHYQKQFNSDMLLDLSKQKNKYDTAFYLNCLYALAKSADENLNYKTFMKSIKGHYITDTNFISQIIQEINDFFSTEKN